MTHRPTHGARIVLDRAADASRVRYVVTLHVPDADLRGEAVVAEDGVVTLSFVDPPPEWITRHVRAFLRSAFFAQRDDPAEGWPSRVVRWRAP